MSSNRNDLLIHFLEEIQGEFDRLRWQSSRPISASLLHKASNAEAQGVQGHPTHADQMIAMQGAGWRDFQQLRDDDGNVRFREEPVLDAEGKPIVNTAGEAFDVVIPAFRSVEFYGNVDDYAHLPNIADRAGKIVSKLDLGSIIPELKGWRFSNPSDLWWDIVFEIAWSGKHPLLDADKKIWLPSDNPNVFFPYDLKQLQILASSGPAGLTFPKNWLKQLPEVFVSEIKDVVTASSDVIGFLINKLQPQSSTSSGTPSTVQEELQDEDSEMLLRRRFAVALSFPGEFRTKIRKVANNLKNALTEPRIFYDKFHEGELAIQNLDLKLQQIYGDDADLIVVFVCSEYDEKEWCGLEWRVIRSLMKNKDRATEDVMFLRIGEGNVEGILDIDGYVDVSSMSDRKIADLILQRWSAKR